MIEVEELTGNTLYPYFVSREGKFILQEKDLEVFDFLNERGYTMTKISELLGVDRKTLRLSLRRRKNQKNLKSNL